MNGPNDKRAERGDRQIVGDRHRQHQPFGLAVLGNERDADVARLGVARRARADGASVDRDRAGHAAQHAEQREQQGLLALAVEAAEPDDLARADFEGNIVEALLPAETLDLERGRGRSRAWASADIASRCRARSSVGRSRRSTARPCRRSRCGARCGTPRRGRRAPRPRACDGRCRGWRRCPPSAAPAGRRPSRRRRWSAPRSPRRG